METVGGAVEEAANAVEDAGEGAGGWIADQACSIDGEALCVAGSFGGGILSGLGSSLGGSLRISGRIVESAGSSLGHALQGRWRDSLDDILKATADGVILGIEGASSIFRTLDESARHWERNRLRQFVSDLIDRTYADDIRQRDAARRAAGIDRSPWGIRVKASHHLLSFDTYDFDTDLRELLRARGVDLLGLGGFRYPSNPKDFPEAMVQRLRGPEYSPAIGDRASREEIESYLATGAPDLRILSMHPKYAARSMRYASRIAKDVGVLIQWSDTELNRLQVSAVSNDFPMFWFGGREHADFLDNNEFKDGCDLAAFGVLFPFLSGHPPTNWRESSGAVRGVTLGLNIVDPSNSCQTADRDDNCCVTARVDERGAVRQASVSYLWPRNATAAATGRFTLAHEVGHWLGLCHEGHKYVTDIMYTKRRYSPWRTLGRLPVVFSRGLERPRFRGSDGRNVWRFQLDQRFGRCIAVVEDPGVVE
ncbi:hypothetical protein OG394_15105 [Kribbella sp. NBC_01245]|uniref:hypothetical protein n=1 Tax=Kribbella sp. NBC_01245 TaxID=2903578 RepID=UPI002E29A862|nr:hypothetical protein [Kribbella sp. NBC_01245]